MMKIKDSDLLMRLNRWNDKMPKKDYRILNGQQFKDTLLGKFNINDSPDGDWHLVYPDKGALRVFGVRVNYKTNQIEEVILYEARGAGNTYEAGKYSVNEAARKFFVSPLERLAERLNNETED